MSGEPLRVGFIVHDAGLTGAPVVLVRLVEALVRTGVVEPRFVVRRTGELVERLRELGPVLVSGNAGLHVRGRAGRPLVGPVAALARRRRLRRFLRGVDVLYSNTAVNGALLRSLNPGPTPVVTHVHELPRFLGNWTSEASLAWTIAATTWWISVSDAVTEMLVQTWGIPPRQVLLVRECIDAALLVRPIDHRRGSALLDVAEDDWVVGCVGTIDQRKGADLFPALARILSSVSTSRRLVFRWLGGAPGTPEYGFAEEELARAGLAGRARFIGPLSSPADAIGRFDVHVVLSREDPYPVVMLEAAAFGRPTVCFANSGGAPEFVARGAGRVVGYLDLPAMANAILSLLLEPDPTQAARCRALAAEHDAESAAQRVSEVLFRAVGRARRGL